MCWSSESFGSPREPQHAESTIPTLSFNLEALRIPLRRRRRSPNRSHCGSIFPRLGRTALCGRYSMQSNWPTTPGPRPPIASIHGCDSRLRTTVCALLGEELRINGTRMAQVEPQRWPFCWWVAAVIAHYSRHVMGVATFKNSPKSRSIQHFLERAIDNTCANPKSIICNKGH